MNRMTLAVGLVSALALAILPACSARKSLSDSSGRATRAIFQLQATPRKVAESKPLSSEEAKKILRNYERGSKARRSRGQASTSSNTQTGRSVASGAMTRLRRSIE